MNINKIFLKQLNSKENYFTVPFCCVGATATPLKGALGAGFGLDIKF